MATAAAVAPAVAQLASDPRAQKAAAGLVSSGAKTTGGAVLVAFSFLVGLATAIAAIIGSGMRAATTTNAWNAALTASVILGLFWIAMLSGGIALLVIGANEQNAVVSSPEGAALVRTAASGAFTAPSGVGAVGGGGNAALAAELLRAQAA